MESPQTQSEISIHQLVVGKPANDGNIPAQCELLRCSLQEGMDILLWRGHFARPETLQLHDDLGRINFSCIPGRHIALCDSGTPAPHRLGACAQSPLHYPYARLSRQRLLLWPIREHYPSPSALKPSRCGCRILARSLRIRSTPTAVASSSVVMLKPT